MTRLKHKWRANVIEGLYKAVCELIDVSGMSLLSVLTHRVGIRPSLSVRNLFLVFQTLNKLMLVLDPSVFNSMKPGSGVAGFTLRLLTSSTACESSAPRAKSLVTLAPTQQTTVQRVCDGLLLCVSKVCNELPSFADILTDLATGVSKKHIDELKLQQFQFPDFEILRSAAFEEVKSFRDFKVYSKVSN